VDGADAGMGNGHRRRCRRNQARGLISCNTWGPVAARRRSQSSAARIIWADWPISPAAAAARAWLSNAWMRAWRSSFWSRSACPAAEGTARTGRGRTGRVSKFTIARQKDVGDDDVDGDDGDGGVGDDAGDDVGDDVITQRQPALETPSQDSAREVSARWTRNQAAKPTGRPAIAGWSDLGICQLVSQQAVSESPPRRCWGWTRMQGVRCRVLRSTRPGLRSARAAPVPGGDHLG
jgi:hypothetical protein